MPPLSYNPCLLTHLELVVEANKTTNLTRITDLDQGRLLHIEDSLVALDEVNKAPNGCLVDIGSGAGYPGIPLAVETSRPTLLVDARKKKAELLESFVAALGLSDMVSVFCGRAELLARKQPNQCAVVTARALAKLSVLEELASPLLQQGGVLVCYKAHVGKEEYDNALRVQDHTGMNLISDRNVVLSDGETQRRIICFRKEKPSKLSLPRKEGMAQKHPL